MKQYINICIDFSNPNGNQFFLKNIFDCVCFQVMLFFKGYESKKKIYINYNKIKLT